MLFVRQAEESSLKCSQSAKLGNVHN